MNYTLKQLLNPIDPERLKTLERITEIFPEQQSVLVIGAFAREILFYHLNNISIGRATNDMDFSIKMISWDDFSALVEKMEKHGFTQPMLPNHPEKFQDENSVELDIIPFGKISGDSKILTWPDRTLWNTLGIQEALDSSWSLSIGKQRINFANPASIVMLKIFSVYDRPEDRKQKDVRDINFILRNYLNIGNRKRLEQGEEKHCFLEEADGDLDNASARLLGYDIGAICSEETFDALTEILERETSSGSRCYICHELQTYYYGSFNVARNIISSLLQGVKEGYQE
jgi:predicted nucleotidyltransferase